MTILKYVTGLFAVFMITILPMILKADDICEESTDRVECYIASFVGEAAERRLVSRQMVERLVASIACEPDIYEIGITIGIRRLVPGGGEYFVNMTFPQSDDILAELVDIDLGEGDTVTVYARVVSPSFFSRLTHRGDGAYGETNGSICMGRRIGWEDRR
ncbi:MAG: hypothetical protein IK138_03785 [Lachnospiraceae bacterium]|nr:hypothetical protein [Lachnospiraceae bacterium]